MVATLVKPVFYISYIYVPLELFSSMSISAQPFMINVYQTKGNAIAKKMLASDKTNDAIVCLCFIATNLVNYVVMFV